MVILQMTIHFTIETKNLHLRIYLLLGGFGYNKTGCLVLWQIERATVGDTD